MDLLERYIIARWCYAIGEDFMSDIEYRQIDEKLKVEMPDNEYVNRSWSDDPCPLELLEKYNMMHLYRDIKFAHKSESIRSINSIEEYEAIFRTLKEESRLSFKLDGWNIQCNYYNGKRISAETRGRSGNSLNANTILNCIPETIPFKGKVKITGEAVIPNSKWKLFQLETGNTSQRNSVSTALARGVHEYLKFIAYNIQSDSEDLYGDVYSILQKCGFETPRMMKVSSFAQLDRSIMLMGKINKVYDYPTDGLVIENSQYQLAIRIGQWQEDTLCSFVTGYEESVGTYGNTMKVAISPVFHDGSTKKEVTVTNLQYILDSKLEIGAPVAFDIRSMAIAVLNVSKTAELQKKYVGQYDLFREMVIEKEKHKQVGTV